MDPLIEPHMDDFERAMTLQNIMLSRATGGYEYEQEYQELRNYFKQDRSLWKLIPDFVKRNFDLQQFWTFIKHEFSTYHERRAYIYDCFQQILVHLEQDIRFPRHNMNSPVDSETEKTLNTLDLNQISEEWQKILDRRDRDPGGAITAARTLIESVCKSILSIKGIEYEENIKFPKLYRKTASSLNLSPDQHQEQIFKGILGSCANIVDSLSNIRNKLGDAHGQRPSARKPAARHAALAANLAGTMTMFLVQTYQDKHS